jgi:small nuclear ribonucleoprotein G
MPRSITPELKKYMDKKLSITLNGNRRVIGVLRGYDPFLNIVLEDALEIVSDSSSKKMGSVVFFNIGL